FEECFSQQIEERHAAEALEVTQIVLRARPELLDETLRDARIIAEALDGVWAHLDRIVRNAQATMVPDRTITVRRQPGIRDLPSAEVAHHCRRSPLEPARSAEPGTK